MPSSTSTPPPQMVVTKIQNEQIDALNEIWDSISTAEGLVRLRTILGHDKYWVYLNAATDGHKIHLIVEDDNEVALSN